MYLRFTTQFINEDGELETGIFHALRFVCEHSLTQDEDVKKLKSINSWFNINLAKPNRFSNAKNNNPASVSLSWFKDSAKEHVNKTYEFIAILEKYHLVIDKITSKNPGYIVYEDEHHVSAIPFKSDRKKTI